MKRQVFSILSVLLIGMVIGCQQDVEVQQENKPVKNKREANLRRACSNQVLYRVLTNASFNVDPNGCFRYLIPTGVAKEFTVILANTSGGSFYSTLNVNIPMSCGSVSMVSWTGSVGTATGTSFGFQLNPTIPAYTSYEFKFTITAGSSPCEGGVYLDLKLPCEQNCQFDCDLDDYLQVVRVP